MLKLSVTVFLRNVREQLFELEQMLEEMLKLRVPVLLHSGDELQKMLD